MGECIKKWGEKYRRNGCGRAGWLNVKEKQDASKNMLSVGLPQTVWCAVVQRQFKQRRKIKGTAPKRLFFGDYLGQRTNCWLKTKDLGVHRVNGDRWV